MEWQPIETAPKNQQIILLLTQPHNCGEAYAHFGFWGSAYDDEKPNWRDWWDISDNGDFRFLNPTHWMPVPPPPDGVSFSCVYGPETVAGLSEEEAQ